MFDGFYRFFTPKTLFIGSTRRRPGRASRAQPFLLRQVVVPEGPAADAAFVAAELAVFHCPGDGLLSDTHSLTAFLKQAGAAVFLPCYLSPG